MSGWLPPPLIACALAASAAVLVLLWLLGAGGGRLREPGYRLRTAGLCGLGIFIGSGVVIFFAGFSVRVVDIIASILVFGGGLIVAFIPWSIIAWGFTLNMLLELETAAAPIELAEWGRLYSPHGGLRQLTADRLGILLGGRFVANAGDEFYAITATGRLLALALAAFQALFGIVKCR